MEKKYVIPTHVYSRVVGFYSPVSQWNKGKQEEFKERKALRMDVVNHIVSEGE